MTEFSKLIRKLDNFNSKYHHTMTPHNIGIIGEINSSGDKVEFRVYHDIEANLEIEIILRKEIETDLLMTYDFDILAKNLYCEVIYDLLF